MRKFRFETSNGIVHGLYNEVGYEDGCDEVTIIEGNDLLQDLIPDYYPGRCCYILNDWIYIGVSDDHYGIPEYKVIWE